VEKAIRKLQKQREKAAAEARETASPVPQVPALSELAPSLPPPAGGRAIVLDRGVLRAAGLMPPEAEVDLLTRQYRKIKHPLVAKAMGRGVPREPRGYLIMIASAMAGEGKTFTALNLALSLSLEKEVRVLLVDADAPKPQLSHVLGLAEAPGLLDVLRDPKLELESLICATNVRSLSFLPAGTGAGDATELLSSARMEHVAALLGQHDSHRIVVFDSPPLLQTTESAALARMAGQIVVVVRAEITPQPVLLDALNNLQGHPGVALVLNQSTRSGAAPYYYYGYQDRGNGVVSAEQSGD
jgi:protein-tyrosine kinase